MSDDDRQSEKIVGEVRGGTDLIVTASPQIEDVTQQNAALAEAAAAAILSMESQTKHLAEIVSVFRLPGSLMQGMLQLR